jgi:hypothetical protein
MPRIRWSIALLSIAAGLSALAMAAGGTLSPLEESARAHEQALAVVSMLDKEPEIVIEVKAGGAVALQFDLLYDPLLMELRGGTASVATEAAGKQFTVRHLKPGRARVVVFGSNMHPLPAGEVGTVQFHALKRRGSAEVFAARRRAVDASGHAMETRVRTGEILIVSHRKEGSQ